MTLPYFVKLLCLCSASFFLVHSALGLVIISSSPSAVKLAERMRPRVAAYFLFAMRLLPLAGALFVVLGLCVPAFLWHEPKETAEQVGVLCIAMALLGAAVWAAAIARSLRALVGSAGYNRRFRSVAQKIRVAGEASPLLVVETETPFVVLAGVTRPRLIISRNVLRTLSTEELDVALRHEDAHRASHDNLKRLLLLLSPEILPCARVFASLERGWGKFSEWAADDEATQGDADRSVLLAAALVRLARMGSSFKTPALAVSLLPRDHDLAARVDRLLRSEPSLRKPRASARRFLGGATLMMAGSLAAAALATDVSLVVVHGLLERLIR